MNVGDRIKHFRKERSMSQCELAGKAGIAPAFLGQLERSLKSPTVKTLDKLTGAMGISLAELFSGAADETCGEEEVISQIMHQLRGFDKGELQNISMIVQHIKEIKDA